MNLRRDVLDMPIQDPDGAPIGRVDGIIASDDGDGRLRLRCLEVGGATLAGRLHPRLEPWIRWLARRVSPNEGRPCRIRWDEVRTFGKTIQLKSARPAQCTMAWAHWLKHHIVDRIPGA
jgi:hypothetical protein